MRFRSVKITAHTVFMNIVFLEGKPCDELFS